MLTPDVTFDTGLDLVALRRMRLFGTLWSVSGMLTADGVRGRSVSVHRDLREFTLSGEVPMPLQVDGDYIGDRTSATFRSVPSALRVIA